MMKKCPQCSRMMQDAAGFCPYCGAKAEAPQKKSNKPLYIALICLIAVTLGVAGWLMVLLLNRGSDAPKSFDFNCTQYTEEMNRILGENKLDEKKWIVNEATAVYQEKDVQIRLHTAQDSEKVDMIRISPTSDEYAVKLAAVTLMVVEPKLEQQTALQQLAELSEKKQESIQNDNSVTEIDRTQNTFVIRHKNAPPTETATLAPSDALTTAENTVLETSDPEKPTTEQRTEPPTEPVTEPPTKVNTEWKALYTAYINEHSLSTLSGTTYALAEIDGDSIPELIISGSTKIAGKHLCWIKNGTVETLPVGSGGTDSFRYGKHQSRFYYMFMSMGTFYYSFTFENGEATEEHSACHYAAPNNTSCEVDGQKTDEAAYQAMEDQITSSASDAPVYQSKDEILSAIEAY